MIMSISRETIKRLTFLNIKFDNISIQYIIQLSIIHNTLISQIELCPTKRGRLNFKEDF